ncbi:saposin B domain protein, partial [Trifolium pratense]
MTSVKPGDFCNKVNLCQNIANFSLQVQENSCEFCKDTISSLLDKIQDPDTEYWPVASPGAPPTYPTIGILALVWLGRGARVNPGIGSSIRGGVRALVWLGGGARLEIIETLLKVCNSVDKFASKCKRIVLEYGPLVFENAEKFLEKNDICTALHACKESTVLSKSFLSGLL